MCSNHSGAMEYGVWSMGYGVWGMETREVVLFYIANINVYRTKSPSDVEPPL